MAELRNELRLTRRCGEWEWRYVVEGRLGAVEFWARERSPSVREILGDDGMAHYGGFEVHNLDGDGPPDHGRCWALSDRACWHDGTSSYATDRLIPRWESDGKDHEATFRWLAVEYRRVFEQKENTDAS